MWTLIWWPANSKVVPFLDRHDLISPIAEIMDASTFHSLLTIFALTSLILSCWALTSITTWLFNLDKEDKKEDDSEKSPENGSSEIIKKSIVMFTEVYESAIASFKKLFNRFLK